jgi:hypothetical protein
VGGRDDGAEADAEALTALRDVEGEAEVDRYEDDMMVGLGRGG